MLRKVESTSDVNRGPEPCQSGTALTFPVLCLAYTRVVSQIDGAVRAYAHAHDDHYLTRSKFNSLLTEMITPHIYIYIHIKPLPVPRVFGARSGSPRMIYSKIQGFIRGDSSWNIVIIVTITMFVCIVFPPHAMPYKNTL